MSDAESLPESSNPQPNPVALTGAQRRALRGLGHHLKPILQIGKAGITDAVVKATAEALDRHELIKISTLRDGPLTHKEAPKLLAARAGAHVAQVIGRTALLYRRRHKDPQVDLPGEFTEAQPLEGSS